MKTGRHSLFLLAVVAVVCVSITAFSSQQSSSEAGKPEDISGMYSFLREGEFVQINIEEQGVVTGFVSRYGDTDSDKGAFLDQFFEKAAFTGNHLTFKTKPVHSIWFEFDGIVERGPGKTPNDEGYRLIRGKLTQYERDLTQKVLAKAREVELESFPQDYAEENQEPSKKD